LLQRAVVSGSGQRVAHGEAGPHTVYVLCVLASDGRSWEVERRFSAFRKLRATLRRSLPEKTPSLDGWLDRWSDGLTEPVVAARRERLQRFLDALLACEAASTEAVARFLALPGPTEPATSLRIDAPRAAARTPAVAAAGPSATPPTATSAGAAGASSAGAGGAAERPTSPPASVEQVEAALAERGHALEQVETLRSHKRVLKREVLLLREAAEVRTRAHTRGREPPF
jgi:hypothetical protein